MSRFIETETFLTTVDAGSLSAAARALNIDKSVVSRRLGSLEARLGTTLLNRSTRGLSLTDAGERYREQALALIEAWREMEDATRGTDGPLAGPIRLAAPLSFGLSYLGPALTDFQRDHPGVELDIDFSDRRADLIADGLDLAVRVGQLADSALRARKLGTVTLEIVCAPSFLQSFGGVRHPDDLMRAPELRYALRSQSSHAWTGPDGLKGRLQMNPVLRASNGDFLRDAAVAGLGVTVQPDFIVCDAVNSGQLVRILPDYAFDRLGVYAVSVPNRHRPRRIDALIDHLVKAFAGTPPWALSRD